MATYDFSRLTGADLPPEYSFVRTLGHGSMAHVFLVRNNALKRLAALKILRSELAGDGVNAKRFSREAQAAANIVHPNVTSVFAVGALSNGVPYIEMQYIDGGNLSELIEAHGKLDPEEASLLLLQLANALAAAHQQGVIHRDVRPANILIDSTHENAYLADFGIAGILETGSNAVTKLTRDGDRLGNPRYMSPEQLRGDVVTEQTDVYSLGVVGYELLTGHGPFGDMEVTDVAAAHIRKTPIDLVQAYPSLPRYLGDALGRCLSKQPNNRPRASTLAAMFVSRDSPESNGQSRSTIGAFLDQLKARKVYRAVVAYSAGAFLVLQVADLVLAPLRAPEQAYRWLVVLVVAGFPLAVAASWVYDMRGGRLTRTRLPESAGGSRRGLWLTLQLSGMVLSIAVAMAIAGWLLRNG